MILPTAQQARLRHSKPTPQKTPPSPKQKPKRRKYPSTAITSVSGFNDLLRLQSKFLLSYVDKPKSNYRHLAPDLCELIQPENAMCLHPCNAEARIAFADILQQELARFGIPMLAPHCWVTLSPGSFAFPMHEAHNFEPHRFMQTIRQALGKIPFLAFIEAGHYRSSPALDSPLVLDRHLKWRRCDMVSWHVHLITWGHSKPRVDAALKAFKLRHGDMIGRRCVHVADIEPNEAAHKMLYASKGQVKSYRHYLTRDLEVDPQTGVVTRRVRQSKEWMRTGDHVKMIEVFGRRRIDELVFGGGEGNVLAQVIRYKAMQPFCRWASKQIEDGREDASDWPFVAAYRALGNRLRREHGDDILSVEPFRLDARMGHNRRSAIVKIKRFHPFR